MRPSAQIVGPTLPERSNSAGPCVAEVPGPRRTTPSAWGRAPAAGRPTGSGAAAGSRSSASTSPLRRRRGRPRPCRGARAPRPSGPGGPGRSTSGRRRPGPGRRPPASGARARRRPPRRPSSGMPVRAASARRGDQRYWLEIHEPRGRPRTTRPSHRELRQHPRRDVLPGLVGLAGGHQHRRPQAGLVGRQLGRRRLAAGARARPAWPAPPRPARRRRRRRRRRPAGAARAGSARRAAIASVQAAWTTGARSSGTTNIVRRIPSIRISERSS